MQLALGVDGGNTKTIALIATRDGEIVGRGRAGCSDIFNAPTPDAALAELDTAVSAALTGAGRTAADIDSACFCLAGADWPEDHTFLGRAIKARGYGRDIEVANDAIGALRAGTPDGVGVIVSCGTGVATGARNVDGETWHAGFWQEPMGGGEIGRLALWSVFRAELGIEPPTAMTAAILAQTRCATAEDLLRKLHHRNTGLSVIEISRLTPIVLTAAASGDMAALRIVTDHGQRLAQYAVVAARSVDLDLAKVPVVLNGGVFRHKSTVLTDAVVTALPEATHVILSRSEPAIGTLMLAIEQLGSDVSSAVEKQLYDTRPSRSFFATS